MTGRGFLVLGATGGIGSAVCSLLVARGACVQIIHATDQLAEAIRSDGQPAHRGQIARQAPVFHDEWPQGGMRVASETTSTPGLLVRRVHRRPRIGIPSTMARVPSRGRRL
jgi:NAD(P)-dependent dehydrogenase (short-subunit alcohol dehydrogenase family)